MIPPQYVPALSIVFGLVYAAVVVSVMRFLWNAFDDLELTKFEDYLVKKETK